MGCVAGRSRRHLSSLAVVILSVAEIVGAVLYSKNSTREEHSACPGCAICQQTCWMKRSHLAQFAEPLEYWCHSVNLRGRFSNRRHAPPRVEDVVPHPPLRVLPTLGEGISLV